MVILALSLISALLFALAGFAVWAALRIFGASSSAAGIARRTLWAYLFFLPAAVFILAPLLFSTLLSTASTRPQDRALLETPADLGCLSESIEFQSADGVTLRGWLLPSDEEKPAMIWAHGLFRSRREVLERSCRLNALGYPVLLFDLRSHGSSGRAPVSLGYKERLDVMAAAVYLRRERPDRRLVLAGVSMGAVAALMAASELQPPPVAVIADSPFLSLRETLSRHVRMFLGLPSFPFVDLFEWNLARMAQFEAERLNAGQAVDSLSTVPILFIYGSDDARMPETVARELHQASAHPLSRLVRLPDAGHGHAYLQHPQQYLELIERFLEGL